MANGLDTIVDCTSVAPKLKAAGLDFVGRYYANSGRKRLTPDEAQAISASGLKIVAVWEDGYPTKAAYFSYAKGVDDATSAFHDALMLGQPSDTPIYFAVDYDASPAEIGGCIYDYFRGINSGFQAIAAGSPAHPVGVYGSGAACSLLMSRQLVQYTWLSQSTGFRGSSTFTAWNVKQGPETSVCNIDVDSDEGSDDYGGFVVAAAT